MSAISGEITRCEVCGNERLVSALDLGPHPMCDDLVPIGDDRTCKEYPIEILFCDTCRTAHQRFQIPKHELFPPTYHYRSRHTADVLNGMRQLVAACEARLAELRDAKVLDVGCNDGSLLTFFRERGAKTFGIEPTGAALDARAGGHRVMQDFLDEDVAHRVVAEFGQPDVITFTNVFAHIEDLPGLVRALKILIHAKTTIVIENHYLGSILDGNQFDTFYHEHPRTYSYTSFVHIARSLGMRVGEVEFPKRYGGNIRVTLTRDAPSPDGRDGRDELDGKEREFGRRLERMSRQIDHWRVKKKRELTEAVRRHGVLPGKAFPGRSAIPIKLLDLGADVISAVYEKPTSGKIGHYVPGTRIPVRSDDDFPIGADARPIVNMAWHIADEIRTYMRERGHDGPMIDIISPADFAE